MRVIAGQLGGRVFKAPSGTRTHPMADKIRGALFNTLGDISGLTAVDAFSGSGALAIEAISRGALQVVVLENDRTAQKCIADNLAALGIAPNVKLVGQKVGAWCRQNDAQFDLVMADPPYDAPQVEVLQILADKVLPGGLLALSLPPALTPSLGSTYHLLSHKNYGDADLWFFRRLG